MDFRNKEIKRGLKYSLQEKVVQEKTAQYLGSGSLEVYATPAMACLVEKAAVQAVASFLAEGWTTVGISLELKHTSATPVGLMVKAEVEVLAVEGRRITFAFSVFDEAGEIGSGIHERFAVHEEKFRQKAALKSAGKQVS